MATRISGPGLGLPLPSNLYPAVLTNGAPFGENTNRLALAPGETLPIPAGEWWVRPGLYSGVQYNDPVLGTWSFGPGGPAAYGTGQPNYYRSDGFNLRVANLTGCVVGAIITATGGGWSQASTVITPSAGNSTWQPIVGGALSTTASVVTAGAGYGIPPILIAPAPPSPGIPAQFVAAISSGTISAVTCINQGAGYSPGTVTLTVLVDPFDPNYLAGSSITQGKVVVPVVGGTSTSGSLTGVLCTNPGAALAALPTLSIAGAGSGVTLAPLWMVSASSISISSGGTGYASTAGLTSINGGPGSADAFTANISTTGGFVPRPLNAVVKATTGVITTGAPSGIFDRGVYLVTQASDNPIIVPQSNSVVTTVAAGTITLGGVNDQVLLQQL